MADLREQLEKIETTPPPDLWAEIEARAREGGPRIDMNITSLAAFRTRGQEQRRRIAAGLVAAAVVALVAVVVWRSFQPATTKLPTGSDLPAGWVRCTSDVLGYSIGFPGAWHTTDVFNGEPDPANACQWFSPTPFGPDGNVVLEGWGYPLEVGIRGPFDQQLQQTIDPEVADTLVQEEVVVDGHRAVRLEYETLVDVIADTGLHYEYLIELDAETSLIVHTTETRGIEGDYEENKTVVDQAVDTLRFADPMPGTLPTGWQRCTNEHRRFEIGYPDDWFTTDVFYGERRSEDACRIFSSLPFELQTESGEPFGMVSEEGCGYPVCMRFVPSSLDRVVAEFTDPARIDVVSTEALTINGRRAVRIDRYVRLPTLGEHVGPDYYYVIELDDHRVVTFLTEGRDNTVGDGTRLQEVLRAEDYERNKAILDQMVQTFILLP